MNEDGCDNTESACRRLWHARKSECRRPGTTPQGYISINAKSWQAPVFYIHTTAIESGAAKPRSQDTNRRCGTELPVAAQPMHTVFMLSAPTLCSSQSPSQFSESHVVSKLLSVQFSGSVGELVPHFAKIVWAEHCGYYEFSLAPALSMG